MDLELELDLDDLAIPATLRVVDSWGTLAGDIRGNRAYLELGLDEPRHDELDRQVVASGSATTSATASTATASTARVGGRIWSLRKTPVVREGVVVGVLTLFGSDVDDAVLQPVDFRRLAESTLESITLLEIVGGQGSIVSQNKASHDVDRLIDSGPVDRAELVRAQLLQLAVRAVETGSPEVSELAITDRQFTVRSEAIGEAGGDSTLVAQTVLDVSDRSRSRWLEQLVNVAAMPSVVAAAQLAFGIADETYEFDRSALLRFDGQMVDVFATSGPVEVDRRLHVSQQFVELMSEPGVTAISGSGGIDDRLISRLGVGEGVAISIQIEDAPWGMLVLGAAPGHGRPVTDLGRSMLEVLGATLSMLIERDSARQRLQESNRRLEEYAHAAAHDLRSPLRRIRSFAQILQARLGVDELDREQLSDFAERIARGAARLDTLLESMLMHANISALAEESTEYTDLQTLAEEICQGIVELSHEPKPCFTVVDLPEVRLPRDAAERVLRNLIDNSLKYAAKDRSAEVELRGEAFAGGVRVRVHDNGIGIEPQFADKVFQLFNQLSDDTSGSGVGLAVVERLLSTRGAKIWVESEVGSGATFVIEFPSDVLRASAAGLPV